MYSTFQDATGGHFKSAMTDKQFRYRHTSDGSDKRKAFAEMEAHHADIRKNGGATNAEFFTPTGEAKSAEARRAWRAKQVEVKQTVSDRADEREQVRKDAVPAHLQRPVNQFRDLLNLPSYNTGDGWKRRREAMEKVVATEDARLDGVMAEKKVEHTRATDPVTIAQIADARISLKLAPEHLRGDAEEALLIAREADHKLYSEKAHALSTAVWEYEDKLKFDADAKLAGAQNVSDEAAARTEAAKERINE